MRADFRSGMSLLVACSMSTLRMLMSHARFARASSSTSVDSMASPIDSTALMRVSLPPPESNRPARRVASRSAPDTAAAAAAATAAADVSGSRGPMPPDWYWGWNTWGAWPETGAATVLTELARLPLFPASAAAATAAMWRLAASCANAVRCVRRTASTRSALDGPENSRPSNVPLKHRFRGRRASSSRTDRWDRSLSVCTTVSMLVMMPCRPSVVMIFRPRSHSVGVGFALFTPMKMYRGSTMATSMSLSRAPRGSVVANEDSMIVWGSSPRMARRMSICVGGRYDRQAQPSTARVVSIEMKSHGSTRRRNRPMSMGLPCSNPISTLRQTSVAAVAMVNTSQTWRSISCSRSGNLTSGRSCFRWSANRLQVSQNPKAVTCVHAPVWMACITSVTMVCRVRSCLMVRGRFPRA